jgi:hypothetical protein
MKRRASARPVVALGVLFGSALMHQAASAGTVSVSGANVSFFGDLENV